MSEEQNPKPTLDDGLLDPELIRFPRIRLEKYPHHAVLRPQWLKSHSRHPFWLHLTGQWHWQTKRLEYAGEPINSPELGLLDEIDPTEHPEYTSDPEAFDQAQKKYWDDPEKFIVHNPPGEIEVIAHTVPEKTRLGIFPTVKEAMVTFEKFWLENRSRIVETQHHYREVVIEAPDWRYHLRRGQSLDRPPDPPIIEMLRAWLLNMDSLGRPSSGPASAAFLFTSPRWLASTKIPSIPVTRCCALTIRMAST